MSGRKNDAGTPFLSRETRDSRALRQKLLYGWRGLQRESRGDRRSPCTILGARFALTDWESK